MPTSVWEFLAPTKPWLVCALFVLHVVALNLFFPLATESHWLRLWAFRETEIAVQRPAMAATALLPAPLVFMGIVAFYISSGSSPDVPAFVREIVPFVNAISEVSPVLSFMFWIGAVAALFSTADTQIYSALVLARFDSRTGDVRIGLNSPWLFAFFSSLLFAAVYAVVRAREIEFDRIIFAVIPCALILLPAIIDAARGSKPSLAKLGTAGFGYGVFSIYGLLVQDKEALQANLAAVLFPVILACFPARKENSNAAIKGPS